LRNTGYVYGVIVYAGVDTKLFLNQQDPPSKFSTVERHLNKMLLGLFVFMFAVCILMAVLSVVFENSTGTFSWYLGPTPYTIEIYGLRNLFTYLILFNKMIPISLWVTMELAKVAQALFMHWDVHMSVPVTSYADAAPSDHSSNVLHMKVKTSDLNEDLGKVCV
jgi:phospholipid-transporting ATPase